VIAYLDASAVTKLFLDEVGSPQMRELWYSDVPASTSELTIVELVCTLAAASRAGRLEVEPGPSVLDGTFVREHVVLLAADTAVVRAAAAVGAENGLRALDAIHVASALLLEDADPTLVSWDEKQRHAAAAEGLLVYP
jgi:predicted nucleic acid-binding protein